MLSALSFLFKFFILPFIGLTVLYLPSYLLAKLVFRQQKMRMPGATVMLGLLWSVWLYFYLVHDARPDGRDDRLRFGYVMFFTSVVIYLGTLAGSAELAWRGLRRRKVP